MNFFVPDIDSCNGSCFGYPCMKIDHKRRCGWMGDDRLMLRYHDSEWGSPLHNDRKWFEFMVLDAFQAGLSWRTVLHKRSAFRRVFHNFVPQKVARMSEKEIRTAIKDPSIIRNRMKIRATVQNAKAFLKLKKAYGTFDTFIWSFTKGKVVRNRWTKLGQIPASTPLSDRISKALKENGFTFVGTTICYAFLQAGGVVNDHLVECFRHKELRK
jgi:DNA-3-methyladenine glycosylase I